MVFSGHDIGSSLHIDVRPQAGDAVVVAIAGEIDRDTFEAVQGTVSAAVDAGHPAVVALDLSEVTFADSAGIRALLTCRQTAERAGARLEITSVHDHVRQVLVIAGLSRLFGLPGPH